MRFFAIRKKKREKKEEKNMVFFFCRFHWFQTGLPILCERWFYRMNFIVWNGYYCERKWSMVTKKCLQIFAFIDTKIRNAHAINIFVYIKYLDIIVMYISPQEHWSIVHLLTQFNGIRIQLINQLPEPASTKLPIGRFQYEPNALIPLFVVLLYAVKCFSILQPIDS